MDNANIADDLGEVRDHVELVTMRGGCACCSVAGALFKSMNDLAGRVDIAVMAANNQTHVENLIAVLDNLMDGSDAPLTVQTVALVDERTTCCFPYVAEMLTAHTDITLHAPFSAADVLANR